MSARANFIGFILVLLLGLAVWLPGLGRLPLFSRDEALYAEAGREMLARGDWITPRVNGELFFEKPPLLYWASAAGYKIFGVSFLAARLPAALSAILVVLLTAIIGAKAWNLRAGLLAALALALSLQMALIGRMGIMDMPLTFLTLLALVAYWRWWRKGDFAGAAAFGAVIALAVLMKSIAGLLAPAIALIHLFFFRPVSRPRLLPILLGVVTFAIIASPWFIIMAQRHGAAYGTVFFLRHHLLRIMQPMQGHRGPVWYYVALILVSFFPWVTLLPAALRHSRQEPTAQPRETTAFWRSLAVVWILVVLIPFSIIRTKLPGYVTPLFPALALLVGAELDQRLRRPGRAPWIAMLVGAAVMALLMALLPSAAARLGERVGAAQRAHLLVAPAVICAAGYLILLLGATTVLFGRAAAGLGLVAVGQFAALAALVMGMLPIASLYLGGAEAQLAELARRELPGRRVALYEVNPEGVAFVLRRTVPTFSDNRPEELLAFMRQGPTALIAPTKEQSFLAKLPARRTWQRGDKLLLDLPALAARDLPAQ